MFAEDPAALADFSRRLSAAVQKVADAIAERFQGEVVVAAGETVVVGLARDHYDREKLPGLLAEFRKETGCPLFLGCGPTLTSASGNVRRAKVKDEGGIHDE